MHIPAPNAIALVALGNSLPLLGVLLAGWDVYTLLIYYWCETIVIAFWTILTIAFHTGEQTWGAQGLQKRTPLLAAGNAGFITLHAGLFMGVHLFLMTSLYHDGTAAHLSSLSAFIETTLIGSNLWPMLLVVFLQRALIFWEERREASVLPAIVGLYMRIVVMQVVIILGAWGVLLAGSTLTGLILLIVLRGMLDLYWPVLLDRVIADFVSTS